MARTKKKATVDAATRRSIARRFNDVLTASAPDKKELDRRTARRLERYRSELREGRTARRAALTPLDVALRVNELLNYGALIADIRKLMKPRAVEFDSELLVELLKEMHPVYRLRPEAYRFAGVDNETLFAAGVIPRIPAKRGPRPKSVNAAKKAPVAKKKRALKPASKR